MTDLSRYRWHTGAQLRRVTSEERLRPLFRDVGTDALALFLEGELRRLSGPMTPLLYTRTSDWSEPYVDHERTGRLVFLDPHSLDPWHSGVEHVFVASADARVPSEVLGYVPGDVDLGTLDGISSTLELREHLGGRLHDERCASDRRALERLHGERSETERFASPLRRAFQGRDDDRRARARALLEAHGIDERTLCSAFHHVPREERGRLRQLGPVLIEGLEA